MSGRRKNDLQVGVVGRSSLLALIGVFMGISSTTALVPPAPLIHTAVGAIAGSTGAIAAYPIDYVKSQLQTEEGRQKYKGGFDAALDIVKTNGPFALYKGLMVQIIGVAPEKTVKLSVNTLMRAMLLAQFGSLSIASEMVAGGIAGMTQVIVTNPLEVVKLKLQTSQMTVKDVVSQMKGVSDLYQGAGACIARDVVFSAVLFPMYAHLKVALASALMGVAPTDQLNFWADMLAGSFAAGPAAMISTPADVVKTRLQQAGKNEVNLDGEDLLLGRLENDTHDNYHIQLTSTNQVVATAIVPLDIANDPTFHDYTAGNATSFLGVMQQIMTEEGPQTLMSGWFERVVRSVPQFGVTLAVFDLLNTYAIDHGWLVQ